MGLIVGELIGLLKLDDQQFHAGLGKAGEAFGGMAKIAGTAALAAGAALVGVGVAATTMAAGFQKDMANVETLLGTGMHDRIVELGADVKKLAQDTGKDTSDLAGGLYQIVSAFGSGADNAKQLELAAKASTAGLATTKDAVNLLSSVTKGYGDTSLTAVQKVSDLSFLTVKLGQTTFPELAASMGKVVPLASATGIKMEELYGAMATLTGVTGNTAEVSTQLRGTFQALINPSDQMKGAIQGLGYESGQAMVKALGMQGTLDLLAKSTGGNTAELAKMFGSVEALNAVLALTGSSTKDFTEKTKAMKNATGETDAAFKIQTATVDSMMGRLKQMANVAMIEIGEKFLPILMQVGEWVMAHMPEIKEVLSKAFEVVGVAVKLLGDGFMWLKDNVWQPFYDGFMIGGTEMEGGFAKNIAGIGDSVDLIIKGFGDLKDNVWGPFVEGWETGNTGMQTSTQTAFAMIGDGLHMLGDVFGKLIEALVLLWDMFGKDIIRIGKALFETLATVFNSAILIINGILDVFIGLFTGNWSRMGSGLKDIWRGLWQAVGAIINGALDVIGAAMSMIWTAIKTPFVNLAKSAIQWGKDVISGFINGVKDMVSNAISAVTDFANGIVNAAKNALGIHSPSKVFAEIGNNVGKGLADGIASTEGMVQKAADGIMPSVGVVAPSVGASGLLGGSQGLGGASGGAGPMIVQFVADGRVLANITARFLPGELLRVGVKA